MANELATSKDITNYLKHVFDLEKMLYQQNEILEHLRDSIRVKFRNPGGQKIRF